MQTRMNRTPISFRTVQFGAIVATVLATTNLAFGQDKRPPSPRRETPKLEAASQVIHFETADGVVIEADYHPANVSKGSKAPVAILIHMYPADRKSWKPLIPDLHKAGFAVLAYDIRGTGGSVEPKDKKLEKLYQGKDAGHFNNAWRDTEAAKRWLADQAPCDTSRIVLVGASIGCSISLHYGSRDGDVKAIVCLSPGTHYFGVDSINHIKKCGKRAILLMSPEAEYGAVEKLVKASGGVAVGKRFPGGRDRHGTGLFDAPYGNQVRQRIVEFVKKAVSAAG